MSISASTHVKEKYQISTRKPTQQRHQCISFYPSLIPIGSAFMFGYHVVVGIVLVVAVYFEKCFWPLARKGVGMAF